MLAAERLSLPTESVFKSGAIRKGILHVKYATRCMRQIILHHLLRQILMYSPLILGKPGVQGLIFMIPIFWQLLRQNRSCYMLNMKIMQLHIIVALLVAELLLLF